MSVLFQQGEYCLTFQTILVTGKDREKHFSVLLVVPKKEVEVKKKKERDVTKGCDHSDLFSLLSWHSIYLKCDTTGIPELQLFLFHLI